MSNFNLHGLSVSNGIAIGKAYLLSDALVEVEHYSINKIDITKEVKKEFKHITDLLYMTDKRKEQTFKPIITNQKRNHRITVVNGKIKHLRLLEKG